MYKIPDNTSGIKKWPRYLLGLISYLLLVGLLLALAIIFGIFLILTFGVKRSMGVHIAMFASFFIVKSVFLLSSRKSYRRPFKIIFEVVSYVFVLQIILLIFFPMLSFIPEKTLLRFGVIQDAKVYSCDIEGRFKVAKTFFQDSVDFDRIKTVYGGAPRNLALLSTFTKIKTKSTSAMVYEDTIYLNSPICPSEELFIHEVTHVWQFQKTVVYGPTWFFRWSHWLVKQLIDPVSLYDYGGFEGLVEAKTTGKKFTDFGIEQQASIIEDYFEIQKDRIYFSDEYLSTFEYFVSEVISK